jgi:hypothetical protein
MKHIGSDHVGVPNIFYVNSNNTYDDHLAPDVLDAELAYWNRTQRGPLSYTLGYELFHPVYDAANFVHRNTIGWLRLPKDDPVLNKAGDPSPGPTSAHYELIFSDGRSFL